MINLEHRSNEPNFAQDVERVLTEESILAADGNSFLDEEKFKQAFFGIFTAWLNDNLRLPGQDQFCFVAVEDMTLLFLSTIKTPTMYLNNKEPKFFRPDISYGHICCKNASCSERDIHSVNIRSLFGMELSSIQYPPEIAPCSQALEPVIAWLKSSLVSGSENDSSHKAGILGGIPISLNLQPSFFEKLNRFFQEIPEKLSRSDVLDDVFLALSLTWLKVKRGLKAANTRVYLKYGDNPNSAIELDAIAHSELDSDRKVLVAELTTLYDTAFHKEFNDQKKRQLPAHFAKKVSSIQVIDKFCRLNNFQLRFIYITLRDFNDDMKNSREYYWFNNSPETTNHICLDRSFQELRTLTVEDKCGYKNYKTVFDDYLRKLDEGGNFSAP